LFQVIVVTFPMGNTLFEKSIGDMFFFFVGGAFVSNPRFLEVQMFNPWQPLLLVISMLDEIPFYPNHGWLKPHFGW
jgi:hypothetical protein